MCGKFTSQLSNKILYLGQEKDIHEGKQFIKKEFLKRSNEKKMDVFPHFTCADGKLFLLLIRNRKKF